MPKISLVHEQKRRTQILAAAMTCFARQGYHATSMDDVVRESGLSVGAIYSYFPSKEDLFLALSDERNQPSGETRHFGLVVDDKPGARATLEAQGVEILAGPRLDFLDPWGNRIEIIEYSNIQFTKAPQVLRGMGLALAKNDKAKAELAEKGMAEG